MKRSKTMHKLAAAATVGMMITEAGDASAATNFKNMTDNIITASSGLPGTISMVSYVAGTGLAVAGVFKLKQHVDNPGQVAMKDGLVRLGCGGGLLSLPFLTTAMQGSISNGENDIITTGDLVMENTDSFSN